MATDSPAHARSRTVPRWQVITAGSVITLIALGLAAYAAAASYESVSALAASRRVPLAWLNPAGIDGGLFGVIAADIVLTLTGRPLGWLRLTARLFAAGTIAANAAAGWPDPVGIGLRIAAPALFVIFTEAGRAVILRREDRTRIPLLRWVLAFRQTWVIWKRQKLWEDSRLPQAAVDAELAIVRLSARYGREWEQRAPADLVFMIRAGVRMDEVLSRVAELTAPKAEVPAAGSARKRPAPTGRGRAGSNGRKRQPAKAPATALSPEAADMDLDTEALILKYIGEGHSASEAGRLAGVSDSRGRQVARKLSEPAPVTGEQPRVS